MSLFPVIPTILMDKLNQALHDLNTLKTLLHQTVDLQRKQVQLLEQLVDPKAVVKRDFSGKTIRVINTNPNFPPQEK